MDPLPSDRLVNRQELDAALDELRLAVERYESGLRTDRVARPEQGPIVTVSEMEPDPETIEEKAAADRTPAGRSDFR